MVDTNIYNKLPGLLKIGAISKQGYNPVTGKVFVQLNEAVSNGPNPPVEVYLPLGMFYNNGVCIATVPAPGTPVVVSQESGGQHYVVSFLAQNSSLLPEIKLGELLLQSNDNTKITLDSKNDIYIGSSNDRMHINAIDSLLSANFDSNYNFTQATRSIDGIIKRDLRRNQPVPQSLKLDDDIYNSTFRSIGLDPLTAPNANAVGSKKNPPFVEKRELIYEFQYSSNIKSDILESAIYSDKQQPRQDTNFVNRRQSRADTLSLTLSEPNYLIETIKGTVVDIFGNILDLNRLPLPIGQGQNTLQPDKSSDKVKSYLQIRELERKSLAYHFEINARKDLTGIGGKLALPDINSNLDYARNRGRFFIDIDKEGQFKISIPASSETGNIPLLTRYENFSSFYQDENGNINPNRLIQRADNLDIFPDSFSAPAIDRFSGSNIDTGPKNRGSITIKDGDASATPIDRITESSIKHGTAYHDILTTCYSHTGIEYIDYQNDPAGIRNIDIDAIAKANEHLMNVASNTINISGDNANAGGRSGSINLDGSLEMNIGANTIDRQSLWLDLAGGMVANIGRDLKNKSMAMNMDGDLYLQLGGIGVSTDSRFVKQNNGNYGAVLDIRVISEGYFATMVRISSKGVEIMTPSFVQIHSGQGMKLTSDADISIEAETVKIQNRMVLKELGGSI